MEKYYTPKIEEFHIGFEYEALNSKDWYFSESEYGWKKMQWEPRISSSNQSVVNVFFAIDRFRIRVKYLDKEDMESIGWYPHGENTFIKNVGQGAYQLEIHYATRKVLIHQWRAAPPESGIGTENYLLFNCGIIKNISELKRVLKMFNLTE
jgi:hypothetical protein